MKNHEKQIIIVLLADVEFDENKCGSYFGYNFVSFQWIFFKMVFLQINNGEQWWINIKVIELWGIKVWFSEMGT